MFEKLVKTNANMLSKVLAAIIFIIIVAYYGVTISNTNIMNRQMNIVSEHPYAVVVAIGNVKSDLTLLRALPERLTYSKSAEMVAGIRTHYEVIDKSMNKLVDLLEERYLADTENVPAMRSTYMELRNDQKRLLEIASNPNTDNKAVSEFFNKEMVPKLNKLDSLANSINEGAGIKLNEYASLVGHTRDTMLIMSTVLSCAVLIAILFYLYILQLKYTIEEEMHNVRSELEVEQRSNAAKSQFLFNMSHDIRTPMNAIIGLTAIAAMDIDKKEKVKECLTKISSSSRQLLGLINDVLDMSRIESGRVTMNEEEFILPDMINDFISITQPQAAERGLDMEVNVSDLSHEKVIGDAMQIKRIMVNIVGNSLKFTPAGGRIWLTIREMPPTAKRYGNYQFIIRDTGVGMSESFMKKLFQPFERAETSTKSRVEGTGLGMAITKNIIDMMGGQIKVESKLGEGSKFTVILPIKLQSCEEENCDFSSLYNLRSLVVDDDVVACENTSRMIQEIGMCSEWVSSGKEAIEKNKAAHEIGHDYHVVIIDWKMPDMDGLETARQIRKIVGNELPIIVLTAYDWADIEQDAKAVGVNAFLSKPIFKSRLYHVMLGLTLGDNQKPITVPVVETKNVKFSGRILLVEDNEINMEIAEEFIEYFGADTEKAWDGTEAVERLKVVQPGYYDLVFMDIQMPQMDGYEATRQIRKMEEERGNTHHVPIVAMSANAFIEEVNKGYACGMDSYITKPVEMDVLSDILKKYLKSTLSE